MRGRSSTLSWAAACFLSQSQRPMRRVLMQRTLPIHEPPAPAQRTLAFLELPPPAQRSQQLDAEARAEPLSTLARLITLVFKATELTEINVQCSLTDNHSP